jgi:antitoxin component YwqK of YwqJK toxin-antitoxin module
LVFEGKILAGKRLGPVRTYWDNGQIQFSGNFNQNEQICGAGVHEYYQNGVLKSKGDYKNGFMEGHCIKFYDNQSVEFEGSFIAGQKNDKNFKEYFENGDLKFSGEYQYNIKHGYGSEFFPASKPLYEGQYYDNHPVGENCIIYNDKGKILYAGEIDQDNIKVKGSGSLYHKNGTLYHEGEIWNNGPHGKSVKLRNTRGLVYYSGQMINGKKNGTGTIYYNYEKNKIKFSGKFVNDGFHGKNCKIYTEEESLEYAGGILEGSKEGPGIEYFEDGKIWYEGEFVNNQRTCFNGLVYYPNGELMYEGAVLNNKKHGFGKMFDSQCYKLRYEGQFENDMPHGASGTLYNLENGNCEYFGSFVNGMRQGWGKEFHDNGNLACEGEFVGGNASGKNLKLYDSKGRLEYSGEVVDKYKQGKGQEFFTNGQIFIEGHFENNLPNGVDMKIFSKEGQLEYHGGMVLGKRHGYGKAFWSNGGLCYGGNFVNG